MRYDLSFIIVLLACTLCRAQQPSKVELDPATKDTIKQLLNIPPGQDIEFIHEQRRETAAGKGAGVDTSANEIAQTFNGSAPVVGLSGGGKAQGGDSDSTLKAKGAMPKYEQWLLIGGGLLFIVGAAVCAYLKLSRAAIICGSFGAALIVAGLYPLITVLLIGGAALIVGGVYIYSEYSGRSSGEALRAVAAGVANAPAQAAAAVKAEISKQADDRDKRVIKAIKIKDGLVKDL